MCNILSKDATFISSKVFYISNYHTQPSAVKTTILIRQLNEHIFPPS